MMVGNIARTLEDVFCFVFPVSVVPFFFFLSWADRSDAPSFILFWSVHAESFLFLLFD